MNNVSLVGRLTRKPEMSITANSGTSVAKFQLAVEREYNSKETDFINIEVYGKRADSCGKYLDTGSLVSVTGAIRVEKYKNKDGENRIYTKVVANNVRFLYTGKKNNNNGEVASGLESIEATDGELENFDMNANFQVIEDDDIPF